MIAKNKSQLTNPANCDLINEIELTKAQRGFIEYCQQFGWGKLEVTVKGGEPVMVSPIKQEFKLD